MEVRRVDVIMAGRGRFFEGVVALFDGVFAGDLSNSSRDRDNSSL